MPHPFPALVAKLVDGSVRRLLERSGDYCIPDPNGPDNGGGFFTLEGDTDRLVAHYCCEQVDAKDDEPITVQWLRMVGIPARIVIENRMSDMGDGADVILISPERIEIETTSGASGFNYRETISLPHIKTRQQLLQLIRLLAPDFKVGT